MSKIAFLDFDGTLSSGYISMEFLDWIHSKGLYPEDKYKMQVKLLQDAKAKKISYDSWCEKWGELWAEGLKGVECKEIRKAAAAFFRCFKANIYSSSYGLVQYLREKGYFIMFISVGAFEVISLAAKELGIDECHATKLECKNHAYTGKILEGLHVPGGKASKIEEILKGKQFAKAGSVAIGDSAGDIGMLSLARIPVALNPSRELEEYARKNKWNVLTAENVNEGIRKIL